MRNSLKILQNKILDFKDNVIDREMLTTWAYNTLMSNLQDEEIVYIDNLVMYPFLSALSIKRDSIEHCTEKEMNLFLDIIAGKKSMHHSFFIKIPKSSLNNDISKIIELIEKYKIHYRFSERDKDIIDEIQMAYQDKPRQTVNDLLILNVLKFISYLPQGLSSEIEVDSINVKENELKFDFIMSKLLNMIDVLESDVCIYLSILYENGNIDLLFV